MCLNLWDAEDYSAWCASRVCVAPKSPLGQAKPGLCGLRQPTARNGAKGVRKHIIRNLYPSRRGKQHRPPEQVRSLPRGFPSPFRAQPENIPLQIRRKKSEQANKQKPREKSKQTKPDPQTKKKSTQNPTSHLFSKLLPKVLLVPGPKGAGSAPFPARRSARCPGRARFNPLLSPLRPLPQPETPGELKVADRFGFSWLEIISAGAARVIN